MLAQQGRIEPAIEVKSFVSKPLKTAERDVILEAYVVIYSGDVRQASNPLSWSRAVSRPRAPHFYGRSVTTRTIAKWRATMRAIYLKRARWDGW